jgi:dTDP-4-dehydrorhamnose 3,5-epimerase
VSAAVHAVEKTGSGLAPLQTRTSPNEKGIGQVILRADSDRLISGVRVVPYQMWPDDRGYFQEIIRIGQGAGGNFPPSTTQVSAALSYPGTIKAFHYHLEQTDYWAVVAGVLQVALVDLRLHSPTFGLRNTLYIGPLRPWQILIPPGVGHGYKVVGRETAVLVYVTDRNYNPQDEKRLAYNDPDVNYDWETQFK